MTESKRRKVARQYLRRVPLKLIAFRFDTTPQNVSRIALAEGCDARKGAILRAIGAGVLNPSTVSWRVRRGWSLLKAASTPARRYGGAHA